MTHALRATLALISFFALTACASLQRVGEMVTPAPEAASVPDRTPREHVRVAVEHLDAGEEAQARAELTAALAQQADYAPARRLMEQIESDPHVMLGARSRAYTVRAGETMSELAERFLGDSMLFYALARYNDMDAPNQLTAGRVLQIPQRAITAAIPAAPRAGAGTVSNAATEELPPPPPPTIVASARGVDPSRAGQLRLQGLQRLNSGDVDGAVGLLRQAQTLDAANPAIQRDLDRALRMQTSLRPTTRTN